MTYDEVADENLHDLRLQAGAVAESLLQQEDKEVAHGSANKSAVRRHLGDPGREVVAVLVPVLGEPRGEHFLEASEGASREHLGAHGVLPELLQIHL